VTVSQAITVAVTGGSAYLQHNLVSDLPGLADLVDTNLVNPWAIATSPTSPFWISDNHSGLSTLYDTTGGVQTLVVTLPPPAGGTPPAAPTGMVFNNTTNFIVVSNLAARFIFSTEDGTISAWNSGANAVLKADSSAGHAIYKGLALAQNNGSNYLYAPDFHNGKIDIFDGDFHQVDWAGAFVDPNLPAGYAPFGIALVGTNLFVTYAQQDAAGEDDIGGPGHGYVNVFDTGGNLVKRFATEGVLNSPWGIALAPAGFGKLSGALLIGNFGDGHINAFDPISGEFLEALKDVQNNPIAIEGLWGLKFGNGGRGGDGARLYFTAGISGGGSIEDHGLFGSLSAQPVIRVTNSYINSGETIEFRWEGGIGPFVVQHKNQLSDIDWVEVTTTADHSVQIPKTGGSNFIRIFDKASTP
jgi:uncharacterized protein (TIGR03118 family)